ncbi:HD domain-containing protein [Desulfallas thermosapovorans]|uniref:HD domain-containing protein n=1 Tax=Desulfallas thermosapovorans TaxID=58137 RepID=UPI001FAA5539|nr:HD domain-containing protein [Desulfallas thermosapovorans]
MKFLRRANRIINDPRYKECIQRNAACEQTRRFCRHDLQHMLDVARITYILVLEECTSGSGTVPGGHKDIYLLERLTGNELGTAQPATGVADLLGQAREIIYAAGLLHDMARWVEYETGEDHAVAGARMALEVLGRAAFNPAERKIITTAIREHRSGGPGASPLGQLICRADDLARPCSRCAARDDCYKIDRMETAGMLIY